MGETPERVIGAFCTALTEGRADDAVAYLDGEASWWVAGDVEGLSGTRKGEAVAALVRSVLALAVDGRLVVEPRAWTVTGNRVALEAFVSADLVGGRRYWNEYHFAFVVEGGWVQSVRAYLDTEALRAAFGVGDLDPRGDTDETTSLPR